MGNALTAERRRLSYLGVQIRRRAARDRSRMLTKPCDAASKVQHVQTRHRLVLIASFFHRDLASPRTLASKFRAEGTRIACLSLNNNARIASPVEPHIHIAVHGFQYTPFLVCFRLALLSYNPRSLFLFSFSA